MWIWVSLGNVSLAEPLLVIVATSFLLVLELYQHVIECIEAIAPHALVVLDPLMDRAEGATVEAVDPLASLVPHLHQPDLSEDPKVFGHLGLREIEECDQVVDPTLATGEHVQDLSPPRFGNSIERVGGGCCSCHGRNH